MHYFEFALPLVYLTYLVFHNIMASYFTKQNENNHIEIKDIEIIITVVIIVEKIQALKERQKETIIEKIVNITLVLRVRARWP